MNTITISLTQEQADALAWIAEYGIYEKQYILDGPYNDYTEEETTEQIDIMDLANQALEVLHSHQQ